jgi:NADH:ubiquinone oxidoreductase subunit 2 (subunit N)
VFGSILATILIGTLLTDRRRISWKPAGVGLVLSLLAVYVFPISDLARSDALLRLVLSLIYVGVPVFFAALCFADRFRVRKAADLAFGWNLLGAVCGGLLEFFSMALGFRALTLVAIGAYMLAFLLATRASAEEGAEDVVAAPVPG